MLILEELRMLMKKLSEKDDEYKRGSLRNSAEIFHPEKIYTEISYIKYIHGIPNNIKANHKIVSPNFSSLMYFVLIILTPRSNNDIKIIMPLIKKIISTISKIIFFHITTKLTCRKPAAVCDQVQRIGIRFKFPLLLIIYFLFV